MHALETEKGILEEMILLRNEVDYIKRGRDFEILIRDFPLWEFKPHYKPSSRKGIDDQLDSVFTWNNLTFLIEAKAEKKPMTSGSEKWKSYKDKISQRSSLGGVIGVFASLYEVDSSIYTSANRLNDKGAHNFVLAGKFWDDLLKSDLHLYQILEFMVQEVRVNLSATPPIFKTIQSRLIDSESIREILVDDAKYVNSIFLRNYEHDRHDDLYVPRKLDKSLTQLISTLRPSLLKKKAKEDNHEDPRQIHVIRDHSGSGKTTTSVNLSRLESKCIPLCLSANDEKLDKVVRDYISKDSKSDILNSLVQIDLPLVVIIDSLDEVRNVSIKQREIKALIKYLKELNVKAKRFKLSGYPIIIILTIREEYYREWESLLEGNIDGTFKKKLSIYSESELAMAMVKYSKVYKYNISNIDDLSDETKDVLKIPINLEIFSNANRYQRNIYIKDIWESKILHQYFEEKNRQLHKRNLGFRHEVTYYQVLGNLSLKIIQSGDLGITYEEFEKVAVSIDPNNQFYYNKYWDSLISEDILTEVDSRNSKSNFRYTRFIEFLIARVISVLLKKSSTIEESKSVLDKSLHIKELSINRIIENLEFCNETLGTPDENIESFRKAIVSNRGFLENQILKERYKVSQGLKSNDEILKLAKLGASLEKNDDITLNTYYLIASKINNQPNSVILDYFELAWKTENDKRFRLLYKIAQNELLLSERVVRKVFASRNPIEWETHLGLVIENGKSNEFCQFIENLELPLKINMISPQVENEWKFVNYLLDVCLGKLEFVPGLSAENIEDIKLDGTTTIRLHVVQNSYEQLHESFVKNTVVVINSDSELKTVEKLKLFEKVKQLLELQGWDSNSVLLTYLLSSQKHRFLQSLVGYKLIKVDDRFLNDLSKSFQVIDIYDLIELLKFCFNYFISNGSRELQRIESEILKNDNTEILEKFHVVWCFLKVGSREQLKDAIDQYDNERYVRAIGSIKHGKSIGFRFPKLIGVVNNATTHYEEALDYIMLSIEKYDRLVELSTYPSFNAKYELWKSTFKGTIESKIEIIETLFPELVD